MIIKERKKPHVLRVMEALNDRMNLSIKQKQYINRLRKGFIGEQEFDKLLVKFTTNSLIIPDLLLKTNGTVFQIDTLVIMKDMIYIYEVKNYKGAYSLADDKMFNCATNAEILNPSMQLERSRVLLKQILEQKKIPLNIVAYVVFIHPEFFLYNAKEQDPFLFNSILSRHVQQLNTRSKALTKNHDTYAGLLCASHIEESPHTDLPEFSMKELRGGVICPVCHSFIKRLTGRMCTCEKCNYSETGLVSVQRHIQEYICLFPKEKLTTSAIYDWCGGIFSKFTIRSALVKKYRPKNAGKSRYYY